MFKAFKFVGVIAITNELCSKFYMYISMRPLFGLQRKHCTYIVFPLNLESCLNVLPSSAFQAMLVIVIS